MEIILFEPDIPQNTGNIVRLCKATGCNLILVEPLGFCINDKALRRAGLDYWLGVDVKTIDDLEAYLDSTDKQKLFLSSKGQTSVFKAKIDDDAILIFGSETTGLPKNIHKKWQKDFYTIPMKEEARCLNLSNSVAITVYEGLRQHLAVNQILV